MNLIITMCGKGSRLRTKSGVKPKWALEICGETLLERSLASTAGLTFNQVIVVGLAQEFLMIKPQRLFDSMLQCQTIDYVLLNTNTKSQVETVLHGLNRMADEGPFLVQNIDTYIDLGFMITGQKLLDCDIYLSSFESVEPHYSYIQTESEILLSDGYQGGNQACTGLYGFRQLQAFRLSGEHLMKHHEVTSKEVSVTHVINDMITRGARVTVDPVKSCIPLGTTLEVDSFENQQAPASELSHQ